MIALTRLRPLGKRIVVERLPVPERTEGGLWMLGREYPALGRVLRQSFDAQMALQGDIFNGDLVYFDRTKPELRGVPGEPEHFVIDVADLYARIRE